VQAQRKLHSFEQTLRPVSNNNQTLRLLFDFVVQDIEDFLEIFVERACALSPNAQTRCSKTWAPSGASRPDGSSSGWQ